MPIQATASKTDLLLQCSRPFHPGVENESEAPGEAAEYGKLIHKGLELRLQFLLAPTLNDSYLPEARLRDWTDSQSPEVVAHVTEAFETLLEWCAESPWGALQIVSSEQSVAASMYSLGRRYDARLNADSHQYLVEHIALDGSVLEVELEPGWLGATADVIAKTPDGRVVVIDLKTGLGGHWGRPEEMGQMKTLAAIYETELVAILHAPAGFPPVMYFGEIDPNAGMKHEANLELGLGFVKAQVVSEPYMRVGPECAKCPAKTSCPAHQGEVERTALTIARHALALPLTSLEERDPGALHQLLGQLDSLGKSARSRIKDRVEAGEVITRPDGKVLTLAESEVESLSKKSIKDALGESEAQKVIDELREKGALKVSTRKELRAK